MPHPIQRDPDILGGSPVFRDTRVPVRVLFEYLEAGDGLREFLEDFPSVKKPDALAVLQLASNRLLDGRATD